MAFAFSFTPPDGKNNPHYYENAPDGSHALRAFYQKGSTSPQYTLKGVIGGFSLYSKTNIDLSSGTEVSFSYKAWFEKDFGFNKVCHLDHCNYEVDLSRIMMSGG